MKDTSYYNDESEKYSQKRYPVRALNHTHFLFKRRLKLLLQSLKRLGLSGSLLEIGCADGVVLSQLQKEFPGVQLAGVDLSPGMISAAKRNNHLGSIQFDLRDDSAVKDGVFDVVVEVGVLNLTDIQSDLSFVARILKQDGYFVCSLSSRTSLLAVLKPETISAYRHLWTYQEYEAMLSREFTILSRVPYGLFIPHIWKIPMLARLLQPLADLLFRHVAPSLFHERIYVLKKHGHL